MVIEVKLPGKILSFHQLTISDVDMIERYFYEKKPNLRFVRLKRFQNADEVAPFFNMSVMSLTNKASEGGSQIHGIILPDKSVIFHPDGVFKEIAKIGIRYTKKALKPSRNLQRVLKNRQKASIH